MKGTPIFDKESKSELKNKLSVAIGKRIREKRIKGDFTMVEFAHIIDSNKQALYKLEQGNYMPSITALYVISQALSCDIYDLLPPNTKLK